MLQKGFFNAESFNPKPYWDGTVVLSLSGAQKFEEDTVFPVGRYSILVAPGVDSLAVQSSGDYSVSHPAPQVILQYTETIQERFMIRAYCGSDATDSNTPGINPYTGGFKINAISKTDAQSQPVGVASNHIFGAGGGASYSVYTNPTTNYYVGAGGNCLGDGAIITNRVASGAGSCLHFIPVGGIFGTDYIRAYHACASGDYEACGSAHGGAMSGNPSANRWFTNGGSSPYGNGGTTAIPSGTGVGNSAWIPYTISGHVYYKPKCAGAYFNGTAWVDKGCTADVSQQLTNGVLNTHSSIIVTYLGPLN